MSEAFARDLIAGLSAVPKSLPCKWFYDEPGSRLFERITELPEYYPTRSEAALLSLMAPELAAADYGFRTLMELGSGASAKTRILLDRLTGLERYVPVDISADYLETVAAGLRTRYPRLAVQPLIQDFTLLQRPPALQHADPICLFFSGSTIGNYDPDQAVALLARLRQFTGEQGFLLLGLDMTRDEALLVPAYADGSGVTAAFNRNILVRANRELGCQFNPGEFDHEARYRRDLSRVEMHLVSRDAQVVDWQDHHFVFAAGESIHTENAYKYSHQAFLALAARAGWTEIRSWTEDSVGCYGLLLLRPVSPPGFPANGSGR